MRGLAYECTESDLVKFFDVQLPSLMFVVADCAQEGTIALGGLYLSRRRDGKLTGDAFVNFISVEVESYQCVSALMTVI